MQASYNKITFVLILFFVLSINADAQGKRKNFLSHGPSVAAFAQGETILNNINDPSIAFYNASLLSYFDYNAVVLGRYNLFDGTSYNSAAFGMNVAKNVNLGLSAVNLASGDVEIRRDAFDTAKTVRTNQWAYLISASYFFKPLSISAGLNLKYIMMDLYEKKDGGTAFDFSFSKFIDDIDFLDITKVSAGLGFSAQNIAGSGVQLDSFREDFQKIYILSSMIKIPVKYRLESKDVLSFSIDARNEDSIMELYSGIEYSFAAKYAARAGYYPEHITAGFGAEISNFTLNYAADFNEIDIINRFSVSYRWGQKSRRYTSGDPNNILDIEAKNILEEEKISRIEAEKMFVQAKRFYSDRQYIYATEMLQNLIFKYPNHENSMFFYKKIKQKMKDDSVSMLTSDFSSYTYASGYVNYYGGNYYQCAKEWMKYLQFDKENKEIGELLKKVNDILADEILKKQKTEFEKQANDFLQSGIDKYGKKQWIACIKQMEKLQNFVQASKFTTSFNYYEAAKDYIDKSVAELMASVNKIKNQRFVSREPAQNQNEIQEVDEKTADIKYREGLSLYANGKYFEAERMWELTLRLNPKHTRAINALHYLRQTKK